MTIKVLVFESDSAFAGELRNELVNLGCAVRVVDDGNVGLSQAQAERPDLILLSIELPRMNGFSVCNKLKKDPDLKDVPLIIMSSESSDETFEQHKKLRTRAEAYVHKPIAFGQLRQEIQPFVTLPDDRLASTGDVGDPEASGIVIDDDDPLPVSPDAAPDSGRTAMFQVPVMPRKHEVDPDVDAFADDAFANLQSSPEPSEAPPAAAPTPEPAGGSTGAHTNPPPSRSTRPPPSMGPSSVRAARAGESQSPAANDEREAELERARTELGAASGERDDANERAKQLEEQLRAAESEVARVRQEAEAEADRLKRDLEELRARPPAAASRGSVPPKAIGGASSKEFLDLRETLSKKDKEILALKQQLTVKDREIFETRDRSLAHEGRVSELDDRVLEKDRALAEAAERADELTSQLDATTRELEDTKAGLERAVKEVEELKKKRDQENVAHEAALAAAKADRATAERKLKDEQAAALAKAEAGFKNELDAAEATHLAALAERDADAEKQKAEANAAREQAAQSHAAALAERAAEAEKQQAEATAAREQAERAHAEAIQAEKLEAAKQQRAAIEAREAELREEMEKKLASLHSSQQDELERLRKGAEERETALKADLAKASLRGDGLEGQVTELLGAKGSLETQLGAATSKSAALEEELSALRGELDVTRKNLTRESSRATRAHAKWEADKASLERAKDALAVALSQLDETEARQISE